MSAVKIPIVNKCDSEGCFANATHTVYHNHSRRGDFCPAHADAEIDMCTEWDLHTEWANKAWRRSQGAE